MIACLRNLLSWSLEYCSETWIWRICWRHGFLGMTVGVHLWELPSILSSLIQSFPFSSLVFSFSMFPVPLLTFFSFTEWPTPLTLFLIFDLFSISLTECFLNFLKHLIGWMWRKRFRARIYSQLTKIMKKFMVNRFILWWTAVSWIWMTLDFFSHLLIKGIFYFQE